MARASSQPAASSGFSGHLLIIGAGITGTAAAEAARQTAPDCRITLVNNEEPAPYQRINLTRYLAGSVARPALPIHPPAWYGEQRIEVIQARVAVLDLTTHTARLSDGRDLTCDRLILATGATANLPPFPGRELAGVQVCRSLADADAIRIRPLRQITLVCRVAPVLVKTLRHPRAHRGGEGVLQPAPHRLAVQRHHSRHDVARGDAEKLAGEFQIGRAHV